MVLRKTEVIASLPLQMALYFNAFYSPIWYITHLCTLAQKFYTLNVTYSVILSAVHIATAGVELVRLYLGFSGNLMEKIPALSGFWIVSVILQLPLVLFLLLYPGLRQLPIERAIDSIQLLFLVFEIGAGFVSIRKAARYQVTRFQQQLEAKEHAS